MEGRSYHWPQRQERTLTIEESVYHSASCLISVEVKKNFTVALLALKVFLVVLDRKNSICICGIC